MLLLIVPVVMVLMLMVLVTYSLHAISTRYDTFHCKSFIQIPIVRRIVVNESLQASSLNAESSNG